VSDGLRRSWSLAVAVAALGACAPSNPATTAREPGAGDTSESSNAGQGSSRSGAAPSADPARCAKLDTDELPRGVGTCSVDADCELSSYQPGCCTQACAPSAKGKTYLAHERRAEDCAAQKKREPLCPPPAACAPRTYEPIAAVCCAGTCATARRALP
jgi:hypothetical protein